MLWAKYGVPIDSVIGKGQAPQPKQGFKFRVRVLSFGGLSHSSENAVDITTNVVSMQKPSITFPRIDVNTYAGTYKTFNMPTLGGLRLVIRDDITNNVVRSVDSQLMKQYDFNNGRYSYTSGTAKFSLIIETLDGENDIKAMDAWRLEGCFIESIEYGEHNYSSGDAMTISMNIEYDSINGHRSESRGAQAATDLLTYVMAKSSTSV